MNWPHGPAHWLFEPGLYMITTGTYKKLPHLSSPERLDFFQAALFRYASEFGWDLRAWAVLSNHYHFIAASPSDPATLRKFLGKLHGQTAKQLNRWDKADGRKVWFQFWDSHITFERSYLARLNVRASEPSIARRCSSGRKLQMVFRRVVCSNCSIRVRQRREVFQDRPS